MKCIALSNPKVGDIREAVNALKNEMRTGDFPNQKITVKFSDEVSVRVNRRQVKRLREVRVNFFENKHHGLCYTFHSRSGYQITDLDYSKIIELAINDNEETEEQIVKKARAIQKRIHENAWDDLRERTPERLISDVDKLSLISIKSRFPAFVIRELEQAFKNKTNYRYHYDGVHRHWTVSTKMCDDNIFRAWYSSEYAGCLNGDYYLLINPHTALYCEKD